MTRTIRFLLSVGMTGQRLMKKMRFLLSVGMTTILAFSFVSCTEEIKIDLDTTYTRLVIYSELTTDTMAHSVSLTKSMDYYVPRLPQGISGAEVTLFKKVGKEWEKLFQLQESKKGIYLTPNDFFGEEDTEYRLTVEKVDLLGDGHLTSYEAISYMPKFNKIDSIQTSIRELKGVATKLITIDLFAKDPPTVDYYMLKWRKNDTLITDSLRKWELTDDAPFNGQLIKGFPLIFIPEDSERIQFYEGDRVTLEVSTITKEFFDYVLNLQNVSGIQTPMSSSIPGNVYGNFNNKDVFGFFTTYGTSKGSCIFSKKE